MSFKELLTYILSIIPTIYLIKRYYLDSFNKKEIQDFEQLNKYFINERYKNFENESQLVKDMLCNTVSYFKGVNYDLVKYILGVKHINLFDFIKLKRLIRIGYLKPNGEYNKNHKKGMNHIIKLSILYFLFILYIFTFIYITSSFLHIESEFIAISLIIGFIATPEIWLLFYTDKITSDNNAIEWYKKNKDNFVKSKFLLSDN